VEDTDDTSNTVVEAVKEKPKVQITIADVKSNWNSILDEAKKKRISYKVFLMGANPVRVEDNIIFITYDKKYLFTLEEREEMINESIKDFKNEEFPVKDLFDVYIQHPLNFDLNYSKESLNNLDSSFVYYLMYDRKESLRVNDVDHIMPKFILQSYNYSWDKINSISNYQLLDYSTNRGNKNSSSFNDWINNKDNVKDKKQYVKIHLIPDDESLWLEKEFEKFIDKRAELIIEKISSYL